MPLQKCIQLNFDDCEWDEVEQVLKDTKLRMFEILAHTPGPFCKHFMEHVCKAASKRRDKEPLTIVFDTERPPDSGWFILQLIPTSILQNASLFKLDI